MGIAEPIRQGDVQQAVMEFCRAGGSVTQLPPARTPRRDHVGDAWGVYESLREDWMSQDTGPWREG